MAEATRISDIEAMGSDSLLALLDNPSSLPRRFEEAKEMELSIRRVPLKGQPRAFQQSHVNSRCWVCFMEVVSANGRPISDDASDGRMDSTLEHANAPIFEVDRDMHITQWNRKIAELMTIGRDEALGIEILSMIANPSHCEAILSAVAQVLAGEEPPNIEIELFSASSSRFFVVNASARRAGGREEPDGVLFFAFHATEHHRHETAVSTITYELQRLISLSNAPIFGLDCDGDINEWNDKAAEITGYDKENAFDRNFVATFVVESMWSDVLEVLASAKQGISTPNVSMNIHSRSGVLRHLLVNVSARRDVDGEISGTFCVAQDITEAVLREQAVTSIAKELRQLIETANAPIFGIDSHGHVNEWNAKLKHITGFTKNEACGKHFVSSFIAPSLRPLVDDVLSKALEGTDTSNYEIELITKTGQSLFIMFNATARRDLENCVVGVVGVGQDITDEKKNSLTTALLREQQAKVETERSMTAYFAHELRNPLHAIDSGILAMPEMDMPSQARELVAGMQLCTSFMSNVMDNLLDVRKIEENKLILHSSPESLSDIIVTVHRMLSPSVRAGVRFQKDCQTKDNDWVMCDRHRILQVLTNVVTNAIKYTVTGSIQLICRWEANNVVFECVDTGPGIPKSEQPLLFNRFVKRGGAPGTGLGLAIAKHLVELNDGEIFFDSDPRVRAGTTCVVKLPLNPSQNPHVSINASKSPSATLSESLRILIMDDIKLNRRMLGKRIKKSIAPNAIVIEACTGEEALKMCETKTFDVIIVDQYMEEAGGVMLGTDFVYAVRRLGVKSIVIGCSGNDLEREFREAGADWTWQKPLPSNTTIVNQIREGMQYSRA